jgi:methylisocitrate lyase
LADVLRHVCARSDLYMVVDAGVGFGDAVHLTRAVKQLESAGAAAIEIEDQVAPKRVSHHRGIEHLIPQAEMVAKIRYAVDARADDETLIIARTGAVKNESFERACERANAYVEAGADAILLMPETAEQWAVVASQIEAPIVSFGALGARKPAQWAEQGVTLVIDPFSVQVVQVRALQQTYADFFAGCDPQLSVQELFKTYNELDELAGFAELYAIEDATTEPGA